MDNLSHSLFGAAVAEFYIQKKYPKTPNLPRTALYLTSIVANNFPDADLLFAVIDSSQLGSLLNHRGFTHTLFGAFLQPILMLLVLNFSLFKWRPETRVFKKDFWILSFLGCLTHILLDYFNSYGVHPLWPLSGTWHYLDSIFIIEPLLWLALIPIWARSAKVFWSLLVPVLLAYAYGFKNHLVSPTSLLMVFIFLGATLLYCRRCKPSLVPSVALITFFSVVVFFWSHQKIARFNITKELNKDSRAKTLEVVLSSLPTNPRCWFFVAPQIVGTDYRVLAGSFSVYGNTESCLSWPLNSGLNTNHPAPPNTSRMSYRGAWLAPLDDLRPLLKRCDVRAWFKFARVPFWSGNTLNDLRFASRNHNNFTSQTVSPDIADRCPPVPAPWVPPRSDLLDFLSIQ